MIGLVYFCDGKIKGYTFPIDLKEGVDDQRKFVKNMVEEGAKQEGNVTPIDQNYKSWSCIVFDDAGKPIWNYRMENMDGALYKVSVEQTEGD